MMRIIKTSLHHIDFAENSCNKINITKHDNVIGEYVEKLLEDVVSGSNKRKFILDESTTALKTSLSHILNDSFEDGAEINAKRLLQIEKKTQKRIHNLKSEISKGSLFQAFFERNGLKNIMLSKADHDEYLDEVDFTLHKGLPWRKKLFKAILVSYKDTNEVENIFVYDTNSIMAKYWWEEFLELKERYTDIYNTNKSFDAIDKKILNFIKDEYPLDHMILRNSTIGYFKNKDSFELSEFINNTLENYDPVSINLPIEEMKCKLNKLPDQHEFDTHFSIIKGELNKKINKTLKLSETIDLVIKDHIENFSDVIKAEIDQEGNKFIKIKSDSGYEMFSHDNN